MITNETVKQIKKRKLSLIEEIEELCKTTSNVDSYWTTNVAPHFKKH